MSLAKITAASARAHIAVGAECAVLIADNVRFMLCCRSMITPSLSVLPVTSLFSLSFKNDGVISFALPFRSVTVTVYQFPSSNVLPVGRVRVTLSVPVDLETETVFAVLICYLDVDGIDTADEPAATASAGDRAAASTAAGRFHGQRYLTAGICCAAFFCGFIFDL